MNTAYKLDLPSVQAVDRQSLEEFDILARVAKQDAGLVIPREKAPMVFARLTRRLRALGMSDRSEYCRLIESKEGQAERRELISALTTNVTGFFRENHHFETLANEVMPPLVERARSGGRVRIWSAGCSSGPEPYSAAMIVLEQLPEAPRLDVKILATDIDPAVLRVARAGCFSSTLLEPVSLERRNRFFGRSNNGSSSAEYQVNEDVRSLVSFRELNLLGQWPMKGTFDAIFCRNVVIYFDKKTQSMLWPRFGDACAPGGFFFLGHSERLDETNATDFRSCGTTTYRRPSNNQR